MIKRLFLPLIITLSMGAIANEEQAITNQQEKESTQSEPPMPLVSAAVRYGILSDAYLRSPSGMINEGYHYQLRSLYQTYLKEMLLEPGLTTDKIKESLLSDWMMRLGRENISPDLLVTLKQKLSEKLLEWSQNHLAGELNQPVETNDIMPLLEQQIKECGRWTRQPSSHPAKRRSCHQSEQLTRYEASHLIDPNLLKQAMLNILPAYTEGLIEVSKRSYYREYLHSKKEFLITLDSLLEEGYTARQLAEILELSGVDYPVVFDRLYFHALREDRGIHQN